MYTNVTNKKIAFVVGRLGGGGAERVLMLLADAFHEHSYDVTIVAYTEYQQEYSTNCKIVKLNPTDTALSKFQQVAVLRKALKEIDADVVISFEYPLNMKTILAAFGLKSKVIVSERNDPNEINNRKKLKIARDLLYRICDTLVCQTYDAKEYFSKKIQKKSVVIANPVKRDLPIWNLFDSNEYIINFCRLEKQKNIPLLIDAFAGFVKEYPNYKLIIYGEGSEKSNIIEKIKSENLQSVIEIRDFSLGVHQAASKSRMFVSTSDYEGLSNSMLEAMAMGMPVICTDCRIGGAKMMIKNNENGILVPCGNSLMVLNAMKSIAADPAFAKKLGEEALHVRENLDLNNVFKKWEMIIHSKL
ncbi:glycosyltransferase involved in cell wall biosynthesis [Paenibacillus sp. BK033]|uniref:glycosyltransferase n=1 Tax=Paenibacillus sp. BK033 TaxID=2512133 RepID=UPI001045FC87|nr:glycosyltransferase [Paenibacillus sp. BK033]TCM92808.1 glycosyltransferase involved in cell wall biosynthesis [Paenibacillus sp. BK033]